jgi:4-hydroxybenzoate polyprenyltransferase
MSNEEDACRLRLRSCFELVRLPNLFTAMADVAMGVLFVRAESGPYGGWVLGLLMAASCLLYAGGVVLNDVFDLPIDNIQRPERPLPSGRISLAAAQRFGWGLLLLGAALAWAAVLVLGNLRPGVEAIGLAGCIVLYDAWLKRTPLGPPAMGACRLLNVLLGMTAATAPLGAEHWLVAGGIGIYVTGLTWFARHEADESSRGQLALSVVVMILGIALLAWLPRWTENLVPILRLQPERWHLLMLVVGMLVVWRCFRALLDPSPRQVQRAVAQGILSLVMLDAFLGFAVRGMFAAVMIMALLVPAALFRLWIPPT